jgi:Acetyltransferase (GNAT) domain
VSVTVIDTVTSARVASKKVDIARVTDATDSEWSELWKQSDSGTYFHSAEWARLWSEYSGGQLRPAPKLVHFSDGTRALVPLSFESKMGGLLNRHVSSAQGTYGGWLSASPLSTEHAVLLVAWLTRRRRTSLVWRLNPYDRPSFEAGVSLGIHCKADETHAIRLSKGADKILQGFKSAYRSQIRKAASSKRFSIEPATTLAEWKAYFDVYQDSLQRWGDGPNDGYGWQLFQSMFNSKSPHITLWLARHDNQVVSGNLCVYSKTHAAYWHGSTLASHLQEGASKLLMFEIIKDAQSRGFRWFDFNPSAGLSGVKFFKQGFNAEVLPAPIVYVDSAIKSLARVCAASVRLSYAKLSLEPLHDRGVPPSEPPPSSLAAPSSGVAPSDASLLSEEEATRAKALASY